MPLGSSTAGGLHLLGALGGLAYHDLLEQFDVLGHTTGGVLAEGDLLQVVVRVERHGLLGEDGLLAAGPDQELGADGALEGLGALGQLDGVDAAAVGGDVAGAETELVGELGEVVLDAGVPELGVHRVEGAGVRGLAQRVELRLLVLEEAQAALQALARGQVLGGLVELDPGGVGRGVRPRDLVALAVLGALRGEQRTGGEVALVEQGGAVLRGGAHDERRLLGVLRLLPGVDRALDLEAAHDEADEHGYEEDRVQPGGHPPVAGRQLAGASLGLGRGRRRCHGHVRGRHGSTRRRREVAPRAPRVLLRGAFLASPHSTNNLSASAPTLCRCFVQGRTTREFMNCST